MSTAAISPRKTVKPLKFLRVGLMAGALATCLNITYMILDQVYGRFSSPMYVNIITISSISFSAAFIAAFAYRVLYKLTRKPNGLYMGACVVVFALTMFFPFSSSYPDGVHKMEFDSFFWLTVPMHLITTAVIMFYVPAKMKRKRKVI